MTLRTSICLWITLGLAACSTKKEQRIQIDGYLDQTVIEGSFVPESCDEVAARSLTDKTLKTTCVAIPANNEDFDGLDWQTKYVEKLEADDWELAGGEANIFFLEKELSEDCNILMLLVGTILEKDAEEALLSGKEYEGDYNMVFLYAVSPAPVCGDDRRLAD